MHCGQVWKTEKRVFLLTVTCSFESYLFNGIKDEIINLIVFFITNTIKIRILFNRKPFFVNYTNAPFFPYSLIPSTIMQKETNLLVVSLEPRIHANVFRDKDRVVIQDFFMATPKHPFFKWFLDDR